ncbi:unnamed protein product [Linum trigynum]|uniref:Uncharacterized protein n=1 Tax=Linum trigynum TaxID=586398 RepID=A0AAV2CXI5_9ROSI
MWLPSTKDFLVQSAPRGIPEDFRVGKLIDEETGRWDNTLIESCFPSNMGKSIRGIPLRGEHEVDKKIWGDSRDWNHIARDVYRDMVR